MNGLSLGQCSRWWLCYEPDARVQDNTEQALPGNLQWRDASSKKQTLSFQVPDILELFATAA